MNETTVRFFHDIAARIGYARVTELHLFPVIRQSGIESGLAVVAALPESAPSDNTTPKDAIPEGAMPEDATLERPVVELQVTEVPAPEVLERHVVYTARYRNTLKGPDRGKWEVDVTAEADAPLVTIDEVVRGVVRRSGDELHPERISGDQFREIAPSPTASPSEPSPTDAGSPPASTAPSDTPQPGTVPA